MTFIYLRYAGLPQATKVAYFALMEIAVLGNSFLLVEQYNHSLKP